MSVKKVFLFSIASLLPLYLGAADLQVSKSKYKKHDRLRPRPTVVDPGSFSTQTTPGKAPDDAVILFDGGDLSEWVNFNPRAPKDAPDSPPRWKVSNGVMQASGGQLQTKRSYENCHFHMEVLFSEKEPHLPPSPKPRLDQKLGNSGVEFGDHPEIQILDSYQNDTYPDGFNAAIYGSWPPLVNASLPPGQWQSYDIYYTAPVFENGKKIKNATYTVIHNGLPVHLMTEVSGDMTACRIRLRPHGGVLKYRNLWVRPLHQYDENAGKPLPENARTQSPF